ncbi:hypothetical protein SNEBB_008451 [Seison nebaliae]|nr:hypothetical protein SNEBB_008451 [Seison nebaliae]
MNKIKNNHFTYESAASIEENDDKWSKKTKRFLVDSKEYCYSLFDPKEYYAEIMQKRRRKKEKIPSDVYPNKSMTQLKNDRSDHLNGRIYDKEIQNSSTNGNSNHSSTMLDSFYGTLEKSHDDAVENPLEHRIVRRIMEKDGKKTASKKDVVMAHHRRLEFFNKRRHSAIDRTKVKSLNNQVHLLTDYLEPMELNDEHSSTPYISYSYRDSISDWESSYRLPSSSPEKYGETNHVHQLDTLSLFHEKNTKKKEIKEKNKKKGHKEMEKESIRRNNNPVITLTKATQLAGYNNNICLHVPPDIQKQYGQRLDENEERKGENERRLKKHEQHILTRFSSLQPKQKAKWHSVKTTRLGNVAGHIISRSTNECRNCEIVHQLPEFSYGRIPVKHLDNEMSKENLGNSSSSLSSTTSSNETFEKMSNNNKLHDSIVYDDEINDEMIRLGSVSHMIRHVDNYMRIGRTDENDNGNVEKIMGGYEVQRSDQNKLSDSHENNRDLIGNRSFNYRESNLIENCHKYQINKQSMNIIGLTMSSSIDSTADWNDKLNNRETDKGICEEVFPECSMKDNENESSKEIKKSIDERDNTKFSHQTMSHIIFDGSRDKDEGRSLNNTFHSHTKVGSNNYIDRQVSNFSLSLKANDKLSDYRNDDGKNRQIKENREQSNETKENIKKHKEKFSSSPLSPSIALLKNDYEVINRNGKKEYYEIINKEIGNNFNIISCENTQFLPTTTTVSAPISTAATLLTSSNNILNSTNNVSNTRRNNGNVNDLRTTNNKCLNESNEKKDIGRRDCRKAGKHHQKISHYLKWNEAQDDNELIIHSPTSNSNVHLPHEGHPSVVSESPLYRTDEATYQTNRKFPEFRTDTTNLNKRRNQVESERVDESEHYLVESEKTRKENKQTLSKEEEKKAIGEEDGKVKEIIFANKNNNYIYNNDNNSDISINILNDITENDKNSTLSINSSLVDLERKLSSSSVKSSSSLRRKRITTTSNQLNTLFYEIDLGRNNKTDHSLRELNNRHHTNYTNSTNFPPEHEASNENQQLSQPNLISKNNSLNEKIDRNLFAAECKQPHSICDRSTFCCQGNVPVVNTSHLCKSTTSAETFLFKEKDVVQHKNNSDRLFNSSTKQIFHDPSINDQSTDQMIMTQSTQNINQDQNVLPIQINIPLPSRDQSNHSTRHTSIQSHMAPSGNPSVVECQIHCHIVFADDRQTKTYSTSKTSCPMPTISQITTMPPTTSINKYPTRNDDRYNDGNQSNFFQSPTNHKARIEDNGDGTSYQKLSNSRSTTVPDSFMKRSITHLPANPRAQFFADYDIDRSSPFKSNDRMYKSLYSKPKLTNEIINTDKDDDKRDYISKQNRISFRNRPVDLRINESIRIKYDQPRNNRISFTNSKHFIDESRYLNNFDEIPNNYENPNNHENSNNHENPNNHEDPNNHENHNNHENTDTKINSTSCKQNLPFYRSHDRSLNFGENNLVFPENGKENVQETSHHFERNNKDSYESEERAGRKHHQFPTSRKQSSQYFELHSNAKSIPIVCENDLDSGSMSKSDDIKCFKPLKNSVNIQKEEEIPKPPQIQKQQTYTQRTTYQNSSPRNIDKPSTDTTGSEFKEHMNHQLYAMPDKELKKEEVETIRKSNLYRHHRNKDGSSKPSMQSNYSLMENNMKSWVRTIPTVNVSHDNEKYLESNIDYIDEKEDEELTKSHRDRTFSTDLEKPLKQIYLDSKPSASLKIPKKQFVGQSDKKNVINHVDYIVNERNLKSKKSNNNCLNRSRKGTSTSRASTKATTNRLQKSKSQNLVDYLKAYQFKPASPSSPVQFIKFLSSDEKL